MSIIENEFQDFDTGGLWATVYQRIKNEASLRSIDNDYTALESRKAENRCLNRYRDVSPYDHSRVVLHGPGVDYINASLIEVPRANRRYILTQGPLEHTCGHFWLMVWEQNTQAVVMLNRIVEKGSHKKGGVIVIARLLSSPEAGGHRLFLIKSWLPKCHQYWPMGSANGDVDEIILEDVDLKVTLICEEEATNYTTRTLEIEHIQTGLSHEILHYHYTTWPDFGVPTSPSAFLNFLLAVRESQSLETNVGPAVIHCSAGIGRSGTFCLVDSCLVLIENEKTLANIDIRSILLDMRMYRVGLIQTPDQLRFSYLAVIEGGHSVLTREDSPVGGHSTYPSKDFTPSRNDRYITGHGGESPPTPPIRTTSLRPEMNDDVPPAPPPRIAMDETLKEEMSNDIKNDVIKRENSGYELRRRQREDKKKKTQDQLERMKKRQQESEHWKSKSSYVKPLCIGLTVSVLLAAGYVCYQYYW